jgi:hypothetical protein
MLKQIIKTRTSTLLYLLQPGFNANPAFFCPKTMTGGLNRYSGTALRANRCAMARIRCVSICGPAFSGRCFGVASGAYLRNTLSRFIMAERQFPRITGEEGESVQCPETSRASAAAPICSIGLLSPADLAGHHRSGRRYARQAV